jgi:hypothetical protein
MQYSSSDRSGRRSHVGTFRIRIAFTPPARLDAQRIAANDDG